MPVELDGGAFRVDPAPTSMRPAFPQARAEREIWASPAVQGLHQGSVFGFGLVTVLHPSGGVQAVTRGPAWIGIAWANAYSCPAMRGPPSPAPKLPSNGYTAVVVGAGTEASAFSYTARSSICGGPAARARLAPARYVVSIPWTLVRRSGPNVVLLYTLPSCGSLFQTSAGGRRSHSTITVEASVPDVPEPCPSPTPSNESFALVPSAPGAAVPVPTTIEHGRLGIVRQIQR